MELKVLVTGTGRCGTNFMANLLTSLGHPCGHEAVFTPAGWTLAGEILRGRIRPENSEISKAGTILSEYMELVGDSSYMAAPYLGRVDTFVIHVVRNPMHVVASLIGDKFRQFAESKPMDYEDLPGHFAYESFMYEHLPELHEEMPVIDRACLFYIRWNEIIEASGKVDIFHRIEDPPEAINEVFGFGGKYSDTKCNSSSESSCRWILEQLVCPPILAGMKDIMKRYGYTKPKF